ncbi:hypothetical protein, partial [Pseudomonas aeruginosa]|uniref:hypothetical protein n=1 Tax=Pseudomonas aeruginosa TaxID=287 RepID=UPI002341F9BE
LPLVGARVFVVLENDLSGQSRSDVESRRYSLSAIRVDPAHVYPAPGAENAEGAELAVSL